MHHGALIGAIRQADQVALPVAASPRRLDGRLDDDAWQRADSITSLTQIEPAEGAAPAGRTVVRVLVGSGEIVIADSKGEDELVY